MTPHPLVESGMAVIVIGAFAKILPPLAAMFALIYYCVQLWQSPTGMEWRARWRRLFLREALSVVDIVSFLLLGFGGSAAFVLLYALGSMMQ